ncbi:MAG: CDP-alcohol phosphatidyltransferase family protein [Anaerolineales bacterium]|nr:CDP-alcohol phosphatidyltransferase family protein [Anaerolineales bacterium]MCB8950591.1 CDP-alcohol phosphatidyltransferase family protein [Ardenticatenales bacterium]
MPVTKKLADLITWTRILFSLLVIWLGLWQGAAALPTVAWLLLIDWTGDIADGLLARRHALDRQTWIGVHDLQVDIFFAAGLLTYLAAAGYIPPIYATIYVLCWLLVFWRWGLQRSLGMLCQAPVYLTFVFIVMRHAQPWGWGILIWLLLVVLLTWPRFPQQVVPEFLQGMRDAWEKGRQRFS